MILVRVTWSEHMIDGVQLGRGATPVAGPALVAPTSSLLTLRKDTAVQL